MIISNVLNKSFFNWPRVGRKHFIPVHYSYVLYDIKVKWKSQIVVFQLCLMFWQCPQVEFKILYYTRLILGQENLKTVWEERGGKERESWEDVTKNYIKIANRRWPKKQSRKTLFDFEMMGEF